MARFRQALACISVVVGVLIIGATVRMGRFHDKLRIQKHTSNTDQPDRHTDTTSIQDRPETKNKLKESTKEGGLLPGEDVYAHDDTYKRYMQCPTTLRKKLLESEVFKGRFIRDIPVLMWDEHITPEEYERMKVYWNCYGWDHLSYEELKETMRHFNTDGQKYMFDAGLHLNSSKANETGCTRCALVGGGGILKGSRKGEEIDNHDYVFRVNVAPTKGYEKDVGSKSTHYIYTITTLTNSLGFGRRLGFMHPPIDTDIKYLVFPCEKADYVFLDNIGGGKPPEDFKKRDPKQRNKPDLGRESKITDFKLVHPDFSRYMEWNLYRSKRKYLHITRPSTGALMLIAALHTCDEVNAYGFGVNFTKYTTHYYDKEFTYFPFYSNHDFGTELDLFNELDREGIISLYKREEDDSSKT
ncbi:alpha-N-acetylgalactosaminide alpha-2,6-sialyltransferase 2-like isoform X2 [Glandiceps talaboti]